MSRKPDGKLRRGWTTGACATAATRAAWEALLTGRFPDPVRIALPRGEYRFEVQQLADANLLVSLRTNTVDLSGPVRLDLPAAPARPLLVRGPGGLGFQPTAASSERVVRQPGGDLRRFALAYVATLIVGGLLLFVAVQLLSGRGESAGAGAGSGDGPARRRWTGMRDLRVRPLGGVRSTTKLPECTASRNPVRSTIRIV